MFSTKICLSTLSLLNLTWILKTHKMSQLGQNDAQKEDDAKKGKCLQLKDVFLGMARTVLRKRSNWLRAGIFLQIIAYTFYYISFKAGSILYLYARKTLGWGREEFITLKILIKSLGTVNLLLILPFLKKLNISDANLIISANLIQGIGYLIASLSIFSPLLFFAGQV